jgi:hypothetical protein
LDKVTLATHLIPAIVALASPSAGSQ